MSKNAWLTPNEPGDRATCTYKVILPANEMMRAAYRGALLLLSQPYNWEQYGTMTESDAAEWWSLLNERNFLMETCEDNMIGQVCMGVWATAPDGWLLCDGASYAVLDYPDLFNLIGYSFGGSGDNFNVPNMIDRVPVGAGNDYATGDTGGLSEVQLDISEMPNHDHQTYAVTAVQAPTGTGQVVWGIVGGSAPVSASGGDQPHENMPPYFALKFAIRARAC